MSGVLRALPMLLLLVSCSSAPMKDATSERLQHLSGTADNAYRQGHREAALAGYLELSALAPADPVVWARLGHLHYLAGKEELAFAAYQRALALEPQYPEVLRNMATLHLDRATVHLQQAMASPQLTERERASFQPLLEAVSAAHEVSRAPP